MVSKPIHVVVGVIRNKNGEILISLRNKNVHQGGYWEFPGGKVEPGETVQQALIRELQEELSLDVKNATPLIKISHRYSDLSVLLDVWVVEEFSGQAKPCEGQPIKWVKVEELAAYEFPEANKNIVSAAQLPRHYAILSGGGFAELQNNLQSILARQGKLIQLRAKALQFAEVEKILAYAVPVCQEKGAILLVNSAMPITDQSKQLGIHLTSQDLMLTKIRPKGYQWVGASCHALKELEHAEQVGVDFAVLGPVLTTKSHPHAHPLGWEQFADLLLEVNIPVYALGGMRLDHQHEAFLAGAQGIAGISAYID